MKKISFLMLMISTSFAGIQYANAQSTVQKIMDKLVLGVKIEGTGSAFAIADNASLNSGPGAGGALGNCIRFNISEHFAVQEDIMFVYHTAGIERNGIDDTFEYFGTEVPIYLMGQFKTPADNRFYFGAGPYFGLGFSGKYKNDDVNVYKKYDGEKAEMKRITNGAAAIIGYEFTNGIQINASYKYGFNMLDRNKNDYKMSLQTLSLGLGYSF